MEMMTACIVITTAPMETMTALLEMPTASLVIAAASMETTAGSLQMTAAPIANLQSVRLQTINYTKQKKSVLTNEVFLMKGDI